MREYENSHIKTLLRSVETAIHRKMKSSSDFEFLSDTISTQCRYKLSASTLKRLWGYDKRIHKPYYSTLSILSVLIGYKDFDDFITNKDTQSLTSFTYTASSFCSKDMRQGDMLWISWPPNRRCLLTYMGNNRFKVTKAHNTKLHVGDSFTTMHFSEGMPLYLDNYIHQNRFPTTFVVGYAGGLSSVKLVKTSEEEEEEEYQV